MFVACQEGHLKVCKWLCEVGAGADIRKASNSGSTPMYIACQQGHLKVCKWLYEVGAAGDITKTKNGGYTPMWSACCKGYLGVCKWLYKAGGPEAIPGTYPPSLSPFFCYEGRARFRQSGGMGVCLFGVADMVAELSAQNQFAFWVAELSAQNHLDRSEIA